MTTKKHQYLMEILIYHLVISNSIQLLAAYIFKNTSILKHEILARQSIISRANKQPKFPSRSSVLWIHNATESSICFGLEKAQCRIVGRTPKLAWVRIRRKTLIRSGGLRWKFVYWWVIQAVVWQISKCYSMVLRKMQVIDDLM